MSYRQPYCPSRFTTVRRVAREVHIGAIPIGGQHPIAVQSMTTSPTQDVAATLQQCIRLAEAGCDIIRITAQNVKAAEALRDIRREFNAAGFASIPLVADIHFLPQAAMEAAKHVEKVRINPGNYADKKKFQVHEYSDSEYDSEIQRLHDAFTPIVLRCRELGRAMRIGTNHGSLSDRIMNRYGDSPLGMVESALEFLRIAESHGYHDIVLSMKASNPKVMIQAYRLMVAKMAEENMHYPLHLGVTEAGDGDDARIKSAIGIGSLLHDGLGDTIRVSLTEDPWYEVPVARALANKAARLWQPVAARTEPDPTDPYIYIRRPVAETTLGTNLKIGPLEPPRVLYRWPDSVDTSPSSIPAQLSTLQSKLKDTPIEAIILDPNNLSPNTDLTLLRQKLTNIVPSVFWQYTHQPLQFHTCGCFGNKAGETTIPSLYPGDALILTLPHLPSPISHLPTTLSHLPDLHASIVAQQAFLCIDAEPETIAKAGYILAQLPPQNLIFTTSVNHDSRRHALGAYRMLAEVLHGLNLTAPIWIRCTSAMAIENNDWFGDHLLEASMLAGALLTDGIGDLISVESVGNPEQSVTLAYNILQGARCRTSKTEYVACPSCGRTLFDLQTTTQRIRAATGHLKGVTIAVMGCIVNGPGEMADADFGYVGGAPGKINLYVGKECVRFHIPAEQAVESLIDLIRQHGKWHEPL